MQIDEPLFPVNPLSLAAEPAWVLVLLIKERKAHLAFPIWMLFGPSNELVDLFIDFLF